jgi:hypothetical protein
MNTVVRSLALTALLAGVSLVGGALFGTLRLLLRGYAPNNILDRADRNELIRLKFHD